MLSQFEKVSFFLGVLFAYPILLLLMAMQPEMKRAILTLVGLIFFIAGVVMKVSVGLFYRKAALKDNAQGYWFNMGTFTGFMFLSWIV